AVTLFGPGPAAILAAIDGYLGSKKSINNEKNSLSTIIYCSAMLTVSVFVAATCFYWILARQNANIRPSSIRFELGPLVLALTTMALVNCLINSWALSAIQGLRAKNSILTVFKQNHFFSWLLLGNLAGASAAGLMYFAIVTIGFPSLFLALPI